MSAMSETWKTQRSSLKISLTTDDGDEVSGNEGQGRFVSLKFLFFCVNMAKPPHYSL